MVDQKSIYKLSRGSNQLPLIFVLNSFYSAEGRTITIPIIYPVAEAFCFHSRRLYSEAHEEYSHPERQSSSTNQTSQCSSSLELFARGATESKISARASTLQDLPNYSHPYIAPPWLYPFDYDGKAVFAQGDCLPLGLFTRKPSQLQSP